MGRKILLCVALAALLGWPARAAEKGEGAPVTTSGQTGQSQSWHDGTNWHVLGTHNDGPNVTVSNPPQGFVYFYPSIMQNSKRAMGPFLTTTGASIDSSAAYEARGATRWVAMIYPTYDDSTAAVIWAVSPRAHTIQASDSLTTYALLKRRSAPVNVAANVAGVQDTAGSLSDIGQIFAYNDTLALPEDLIVVTQHSPTPRGRGIEFSFSGDFISLRLRILNTVTKITQIAFMARDPLTSYKVDLYGYRE